MRIVLRLVFHVACVLAISCSALFAQPVSVNGTVSSVYLPVRNALVTFIDEQDTTRTYSAITDTTGGYVLDVLLEVTGSGTLPATFELKQNYPNPFMTETSIGYQLSSSTDVHVTIYDILGRVVKHFDGGEQRPGAYDLQWDGTNALNRKVATGIYFCRLQTKEGSQVRKMLFGMGEPGLPSFRPDLSTGRSPVGAPAAPSVASGTYSVRIENSDSTFPPITSRTFTGLTVSNDTTLNFTVNTTNFFPAVVNRDSTRQLIRGFGGANILPWRPDLTEADVAKLFGTGTGDVGMSILRLRIPTTSAEFAPQVITAQRALAYGATIMASPWSPPAAMKSNNNIVGGRLNDTSYASYALHLKSFVDFMATNGVPLYAVSVQNEPDVTVTYESCDWNADEMRTFARNNASVIGTRVIVPESFNFNHTISDSVLNDSLAASHVDIIGGHIYGGGLVPYPLAAAKGKELWMTEHLVLDTLWTDALGTAREINDCMNAGMNAYVWWYIKRFYGPLDENGAVTRRGFAISQFARFVRPGATHVAATPIPRALVDVTAYRRNTSTVIVAINRNTTAVSQTFIVRGGNAPSFTPYVSSPTKNCVGEGAVAVQAGAFTFPLEPQSVTTFVSN